MRANRSSRSTAALRSSREGSLVLCFTVHRPVWRGHPVFSTVDLGLLNLQPRHGATGNRRLKTLDYVFEGAIWVRRRREIRVACRGTVHPLNKQTALNADNFEYSLAA